MVIIHRKFNIFELLVVVLERYYASVYFYLRVLHTNFINMRFLKRQKTHKSSKIDFSTFFYCGKQCFDLFEGISFRSFLVILNLMLKIYVSKIFARKVGKFINCSGFLENLFYKTNKKFQKNVLK